MFRHLLMSSGAQIFRAPEDDQGAASADGFDPLDDFTDDDGGDEGDEGGEGYDGDDDGEGDPDDEGDDEDEPPARREKPKSRAEKRVDALLAKTAELEAQLTTMRTTQAQPTGPSQAELEQREAQTLAAMTAEERVAYHLDKQSRNTNAALAGLQFQIADTADRAAFSALCTQKPALAKLSAKVESTLADMRAKGQTAPRETVAAYLLGQQLLSGKSNAPKQRREAAANRERQAARPGTGRSDARPTAGRATERTARAKRLEGQQI